MKAICFKVNKRLNSYNKFIVNSGFFNFHSSFMTSNNSVSSPDLSSYDLNLIYNSPTMKNRSPLKLRMPSDSKNLLLSIGIISDIQCSSDLDIRTSFDQTELRYYQNALSVTKSAVENWATYNKEKKNKIEFAVHLGDLIDGFNKTKGFSEKSFQAIMNILNGTNQFPIYQILGNHDLYNFNRDKWIQELKLDQLHNKSYNKNNEIKPSIEIHSVFDKYLKSAASNLSEDELKSQDLAESIYYDFSPHPSLRFIMLDTYDISYHGRSESHLYRKVAELFLKERNHNTDINAPPVESGPNRKFVAFNAGVSPKQLNWLATVLEDCAAKSQYAILFSHTAFHPDACDEIALVWNGDEILDVIARSPPVVIATLSGHDHTGNSTIDNSGILHHVFEAILTTPPNRDCYGRIDFYADHLEIIGVDVMRSKNFMYRKDRIQIKDTSNLA